MQADHKVDFDVMNPIGRFATPGSPNSTHAVSLTPGSTRTPSAPSQWKPVWDTTYRFLVTYAIPAKCWYIVLFVAIHPIKYDLAINRPLYWSAFWLFFGGAWVHLVAKKNQWRKIWKINKNEKYDGQEWIECMSVFNSMSSIFALIMKIVALGTTEKAGDISYFTPWFYSALAGSFIVSVVLRVFVSRSVDMLIATVDWYKDQSNPPYIETLLESQKKLNDVGAVLGRKQLNRKRALNTFQHALTVGAAGGMLNELLAVPIKALSNPAAHVIFYFGPLFAAVYGGFNHYFFKDNGCGRILKTQENKEGRPIAPGATVLRICDTIMVFTFVGLGLIMLYLSVPQLNDQSSSRVSETVKKGSVPLPIWAIVVAAFIAFFVAREASFLAYEIVKAGRPRRMRGASVERSPASSTNVGFQNLAARVQQINRAARAFTRK